MIKRIGFACKWVDNDPFIVEATSFKKTTVRWCKENPNLVGDKLSHLVEQNCNALDMLIQQVSLLPPSLRMCRLTSEILPLFTHEIGQNSFYNSSDTMRYIKARLIHTGKAAQAAGIRLSFHPGQFTVLNTNKAELLANSIAEVEMHTQQAIWLGAGTGHTDRFCVNIHAGGKAGGLDAFKRGIQRLSPEAQSLLTVENDEFSWSIQDLVDANLGVPIVLDVHHHWIHTGEFLQPTSTLWNQVKATWKDQRPKIHCAMSDQKLLAGYENSMPVLSELLKVTNKSSLRAHSQTAHHIPSIDYFLSFWDDADLMWEGKNKNLDQGIIYQRSLI